MLGKTHANQNFLEKRPLNSVTYIFFIFIIILFYQPHVLLDFKILFMNIPSTKI
jgi:hypothetical protein